MYRFQNRCSSIIQKITVSLSKKGFIHFETGIVLGHEFPLEMGDQAHRSRALVVGVEAAEGVLERQDGLGDAGGR